MWGSALKLLDLFCGAGGAAVGYHRAGFDVIGVDIKPQPNYPFPIFVGDAILLLNHLANGDCLISETGDEYSIHDFAAIHASPPCQRYSCCTPTKHRDKHPDLIGPTRDAISRLELPFAIENVAGARKHLINPILLCGSMFGLRIFRHRYFELNVPTGLLPPCHHSFQPVYISGSTGRAGCGFRRRDYSKQEKSSAIGIDWMDMAGLNQAIPPAYTEWIGKQLIKKQGLKWHTTKF